jgi:hypothetical protein
MKGLAIASAYVASKLLARPYRTLHTLAVGMTSCPFRNLQTIRRNGLHKYNNQDHAMLTAMLAVRNLQGERHDLWEVNTERSYHEEVPATPAAAR